jgi:hypothetical protein
VCNVRDIQQSEVHETARRLPVVRPSRGASAAAGRLHRPAAAAPPTTGPTCDHFRILTTSEKTHDLGVRDEFQHNFKASQPEGPCWHLAGTAPWNLAAIGSSDRSTNVTLLCSPKAAQAQVEPYSAQKDPCSAGLPMQEAESWHGMARADGTKHACLCLLLAPRPCTGIAAHCASMIGLLRQPSTSY